MHSFDLFFLSGSFEDMGIFLPVKVDRRSILNSSPIIIWGHIIIIISMAGCISKSGSKYTADSTYVYTTHIVSWSTSW